MIRIGKINRLFVKQKWGNIIHLDGGRSGDILLKGKCSAEKYQPGDEIEVFVYVDREQRLLATSQKPYGMVGEFATLQVVANSAAGSFMNWGLDSDLFVPRSEQQEAMREGTSYVVFIFLYDKNNRITASSKLDKFFDPAPPKYPEGEEVDLLVYAETALGYSAVVNSAHAGMIYKNEVFQAIVIGQRLRGFVKKVREDGKIDLRLQQTGYGRVDDISQVILDIIKDRGGRVAVTDKSPPEDVYALFGVSKKVFKKAVGALYKQRLVVIDPDGIEIAGVSES
ncbi:GntR family transcriptional regulator [Desulfopila sp. IMCC35006]|uniref:CvfB family protein n=1 Tax=Desulfopila sp. IMCC35006 TaxID=2569542 RepID=UPI0010AD97A3|nr:S1-like domain-containing RNA-binding protein [Desulfopila sp. IMCC35006]TKB24784.1 GntR family transcriptional regulator [Desulfopila sp. IMCC35006]